MNALLLTTLAVGFASSSFQEAERPDLVGRVLTEDATPVAGASIFVYTAAPREGTSPL